LKRQLCANSSQTLLSTRFLKLSLSDQNELSSLSGRAVFEGNSLFTLFEQPALLRFLEKLNPAFKPPQRYQLDNEFLDNAYIGSMRNRWNSIVKHLETCRRTITTHLSALIPTIEHRFNRLVNDLHYLAHWLCPANIGVTQFYELERQRVLNALKEYIQPSQFSRTRILFLEYYTQTGEFKEANWRWGKKDDTILF
jgi:hypothetical protein